MKKEKKIEKGGWLGAGLARAESDKNSSKPKAGTTGILLPSPQPFFGDSLFPRREESLLRGESGFYIGPTPNTSTFQPIQDLSLSHVVLFINKCWLHTHIVSLHLYSLAQPRFSFCFSLSSASGFFWKYLFIPFDSEFWIRVSCRFLTKFCYNLPRGA